MTLWGHNKYELSNKSTTTCLYTNVTCLHVAFVMLKNKTYIVLTTYDVNKVDKITYNRS